MHARVSFEKIRLGKIGQMGTKKAEKDFRICKHRKRPKKIYERGAENFIQKAHNINIGFCQIPANKIGGPHRKAKKAMIQQGHGRS